MSELARARPEDLRDIARRAMVEYGLEPDYPPEALRELATIDAPADGESLPDLRDLLWCSIDNDDSRDLDQLTVAEPGQGGAVKMLVAVADVDALVHKASAIDRHAERNTTSVYTAAGVFAMLPEKLSTDLTSLNEGEDRVALVVEYLVDGAGAMVREDVYRALVHNHAKLAYRGVAAWLEGEGELPAAAARVPGLDAQLRIQDEVADRLRDRRYEQGALDLETGEGRPVVSDGLIVDFAADEKSRSRALIEDFMIAANGVVARFLHARRRPVFRRVVRTPAQWERIVRLAADVGEALPDEPDTRALAAFLRRRRAADPRSFGELSLAVVKLIGSGEYVVEHAGRDPGGHFGLAVRDYSHSTAPNRRFPDLVTHRLVKAALADASTPYGDEELDALAQHCTEQEDQARKVERQVGKSAAALLLARRIGDIFDAIVTGASAKGTWVRVHHPTIEGKLVQGQRGLEVGDRVRVRLVDVNVERGFIDFARA